LFHGTGVFRIWARAEEPVHSTELDCREFDRIICTHFMERARLEAPTMGPT